MSSTKISKSMQLMHCVIRIWHHFVSFWVAEYLLSVQRLLGRRVVVHPQHARRTHGWGRCEEIFHFWSPSFIALSDMFISEFGQGSNLCNLCIGPKLVLSCPIISRLFVLLLALSLAISLAIKAGASAMPPRRDRDIPWPWQAWLPPDILQRPSIKDIANLLCQVSGVWWPQNSGKILA